MSYFFFSYARANLSQKGEADHLLRFYNDLDRHIQEHKGNRGEAFGFIDRNIRGGEVWPDALAKALSQCKVMVAMFSPSFFLSEYCGKEWTVFSDRISHHYQGRHCPLILPVLWIPIRDMDSPPGERFTNIERSNCGLGDTYQSCGLKHVMQMTSLSEQYQAFVHNFAENLIHVVSKCVLPPSAELPRYGDVASAFPITIAGRADGQSEEVGVEGDFTRGILFDSRRIRAIAIAGGGGRAVSASADHTLRVWDLQRRKELCLLQGHTDQVRAVAVSRNARKAISASFDGTLKLWDLDYGTELRTLRGHTNNVRWVALSQDEHWAVSCSADYNLKVWNLHALKAWDVEKEKEPVTLLRSHENLVNAVALTNDGRAISASDDKTLKVWDLRRRKLLHTLVGHGDYVLGVTVCKGDQFAVSASFDGTLKVWNLQTGNLLKTLTGHEGPVRAVAVTANGRQAVSASYDNTIRVWDLEACEERKTFSGGRAFTACDISPDGRTVVAGDALGTVHFLDIY